MIPRIGYSFFQSRYGIVVVAEAFCPIWQFYHEFPNDVAFQIRRCVVDKLWNNFGCRLNLDEKTAILNHNLELYQLKSLIPQIFFTRKIENRALIDGIRL